MRSNVDTRIKIEDPEQEHFNYSREDLYDMLNAKHRHRIKSATTKKEKAEISASWDFVTEEGLRVGWIWPDDFEMTLRSLFGDSWVSQFNAITGISEPTIRAYAKGRLPIKKDLGLLITYMRHYSKGHKTEARAIHGLAMEAPWLHNSVSGVIPLEPKFTYYKGLSERDWRDKIAAMEEFDKEDHFTENAAKWLADQV